MSEVWVVVAGKRHIAPGISKYRRRLPTLCGIRPGLKRRGKAVDSTELCGTCLRIGKRIGRQAGMVEVI